MAKRQLIYQRRYNPQNDADAFPVVYARGMPDQLLIRDGQQAVFSFVNNILTVTLEPIEKTDG